MKRRILGENKKGRTLILAVFLAAMLLVGSFHAGTVFGASTEPGSSGDPLITKSYLDGQLKEIQAGGFHKIKVKSGKTLEADSGTQIILYSGSATVSSAGSLLNITEGNLFETGNTIAKYQSYLVPENGRGITCSSECILFVQGSYR